MRARSEPAKDSKPRARGLGRAHPEQLQRDLGIWDLSGPAEGPQAIHVLAIRGRREARAWNCEVRLQRGHRLVPVAENYDWLGYAAEAIPGIPAVQRYGAARAWAAGADLPRHGLDRVKLIVP
jgi:hypothetical protein